MAIRTALTIERWANYILFTNSFFKPVSLKRLTPGLEPCSPHSQCGALPYKLKPTFITKLLLRIDLNYHHQFQRLICLPLHHSIICGSYEDRTHSLGSTIRNVAITPTNHLYSIHITKKPGHFFWPGFTSYTDSSAKLFTPRPYNCIIIYHTKRTPAT